MLAATALPACDLDTADCDELPSRIELVLTADSLAPGNPSVCRGDEVTLVVAPQVDGVFHIHGYDAEVPATSLSEGEVTELDFSAVRSGQFPIELHTDDSTDGVDVGIFTVHEP